jgi:hypothetical protein
MQNIAKSDTADPIIERFAQDSVKKLGLFHGATLRCLYQLRQSASKNRKFDNQEKQSYFSRIDQVRRLLFSYRRNIIIDTKRGRSRPKVSYDALISQFLDLLPALGENLTHLYTERRRKMVFLTEIDSTLRTIIQDFEDLSESTRLLNLAFRRPKDPIIVEQIYRRVLSEHLTQENAPFLFDIVEYIIKLRIAPSGDASENDIVSQGIAHLTRSANQLLAALEQSNVDRRFLAAVKDYCEALTRKFNPILIDLLSNRLRSFIVELKNELSGYIIAETTALLLSQEQVLRQFPEWQQFSRAASEFHPSKELMRDQQSALAAVTRETRSATSVAAPEVIGALERLEEAGNLSNARETVSLGVWRSFENFIKSNIGEMIEMMRSLSKSLSVKEDAYLRYIGRILPYIKMVVKMKESLHWLIPVVEWIEEITKRK